MPRQHRFETDRTQDMAHLVTSFPVCLSGPTLEFFLRGLGLGFRGLGFWRFCPKPNALNPKPALSACAGFGVEGSGFTEALNPLEAEALTLKNFPRPVYPKP